MGEENNLEPEIVLPGQAPAAPEEPEADPGLESAEMDLPAPVRKALNEREYYLNQWKRATADYQNLKKRAAGESQLKRREILVSLARELLPVLDNLKRAEAAAGDGESGSEEQLRAGITLIREHFEMILAGRGLEPVPALGEAFDPRWHEAVSQVFDKDLPDLSVAEVLQEGYRLGKTLVRPAQVIISKQPPAAGGQAPEEGEHEGEEQADGDPGPGGAAG